MDKNNNENKSTISSRKFREKHPRKAKIQSLAGSARTFVRKSDESELRRLQEIQDMYDERIKLLEKENK